MRALCDVNVLIALFDGGHVHHDLAHRWWFHNRRSGWATCPLTENGFVRVLSQPHYPNRVSATVAIDFLESARQMPGHEFWTDDISLTSQEAFVRDRILSSKLITDLYLLSLAVRRNARLVTFDKNVPLSAVVGATTKNLIAL
jgi:toxin-antitoxin system PIN domain toxin